MQETNKVNKYEAFTMAQINRKEINKAPYNPRKISKEAADKLKKSLKDFGILTPVIVNKNTMNIVGGHQRITALDSLMKTDDYEITVAMVELDEKEEIKANIVLNNSSVMGEWDDDLLANIKLDFPEIDFEKDLGFDKYDIDLLFADTEASGDVFSAFESQKEIKSDIDKIREIDKLKAAKKAYRDETRNSNLEGETFNQEKDDYMVTIVFPGNAEKHEFMKHIHEKTTERYIKHTKIYDIQDGKYRAYGSIEA